MGSKLILRSIHTQGNHPLGSAHSRNPFLFIWHRTGVLNNVEKNLFGFSYAYRDYSSFKPYMSVSHGYHPLLKRTNDHRLFPHNTFNTSNIQWKDFSSSSDKDQSAGLDNENNKNGVETSPKSLSILQRFKNAYKEYGKVLIGVHVATSVVWYGAFFYAARSGIDVVPLLVKMGASDSIIKPFQSTGAGNFAVAYLLYKIATPARYTVTIGGTQLTVRQLRNMGYMEKPSEQDSLRNLVKQSRTQMRDQVEKVKDKMEDVRDNVKDKMEDVRDNVKDRIDDVRVKGNVKDRIEDVRDSVKDRIDDVRYNVKDKMEDVKDNVKDRMDDIRVKGNVKDRMEDVKDRVGDISENLKDKYEDLKDSKKLQDFKESSKDKLGDLKKDLKKTVGKVKRTGKK